MNSTKQLWVSSGKSVLLRNKLLSLETTSNVLKRNSVSYGEGQILVHVSVSHKVQ